MEKVVVHVDGGARGNPGPAAVAAVASADGELLLERSEYIGEATNNTAEYRALLLGLELARELGAREVEVVNDSELVARQIGASTRSSTPACARYTSRRCAPCASSSAGRCARCAARRTRAPTSW